MVHCSMRTVAQMVPDHFRNIVENKTQRNIKAAAKGYILILGLTIDKVRQDTNTNILNKYIWPTVKNSGYANMVPEV